MGCALTRKCGLKPTTSLLARLFTHNQRLPIFEHFLNQTLKLEPFQELSGFIVMLCKPIILAHIQTEDLGNC